MKGQGSAVGVRLRVVALACAATIVAGACTGEAASSRPARSESVPTGGTLRLAIPDFDFSVLASSDDGLDPQRAYWADAWELFRCCLLRTLLSHLGRPTDEGGAVLRPDLASALPTTSSDGLTWTFHVKSGLHYAPPFQDVEVTAGDVIRALEREARLSAPEGYSFYYSNIEGFDAFAAGDAGSIAGLEAPDAHTLVVRLGRPEADLGNLFTLAASAPIPQGAADGHDEGYGRFLVASGPYMLDGSEDADPSLPPEQQTPVSGYRPGRSITLVRNPSWSSGSDDLRPAYVDRIEIEIGGDRSELSRRVVAGGLDMQLFSGPPPQEPLGLVDRLLDDPERRDQVFVNSRDFLRYIPMNVAEPPFDDLAVRKAVNYAVDKQALLEIRGGPVTGRTTGHVALNSLENNLLLHYDPYETPGGRGSPRLARSEMAASRYDHDGDGRCDDPSCRGVLALVFDTPPIPAMARSIASDLSGIGIELDLRMVASNDVFARMGDPSRHVPIAIGPAWGKDFLSASNFIEPLFGSQGIALGLNLSDVGASPPALRRWGYEATAVPSVDGDIERCLATLGDAQFECWAQVDQLLMERVVPWVPFVEENRVQIVSDRVVRYSFDQFANLPALERIALAPE